MAETVIFHSMRNARGMTLLELLIATSLLAAIVLATSSIDLFSRYQVLSSDRRVKAQNTAAFCIDHMTKHISGAIGNINSFPVSTLPPVINGANSRLIVTIDSNLNGVLDSSDTKIMYRFTGPNGGHPYQIWYYPNYTGWGSTYEVIASDIINFVPRVNTSNNYVDIQINACSNPGLASDPCGTVNNPTISMRSRINMPSVSTH